MAQEVTLYEEAGRRHIPHTVRSKLIADGVKISFDPDTTIYIARICSRK